METFSIDEILNELPPPEKESPKNKFYNGRSSANGGASIVDLFNQSGRYLNPLPNCPGGHAVTCLWSDLHSNAQMPGDTSTAIFEAEGEKPPGFKCMHSHCADRNIKDVYKFFGYGGDHHWSREKNSAAKENADTNSSFNETDQVWEKIIPIDEFEVRPLDQSLFPDPLNRFIEAVSRSSETPPELAAMMALGAVSLSVTGKYEIETVNGHAEPLNLYLLCALESGNRKTSVLNLCKAPLEVWEAAKGNEFSSAIKEATAKKKNEEAKIKKLRASLGERKPIEDQITEREIIKLESELTEIPVRPRLIANDVTPERLASLLFEQGERMGVISDEGGIFDLIAGRYNKGVPNMDLYLKAYDGSSCRVDREGTKDQAIYLRNPLIVTAVCPQPSVIQAFSEKPQFRDRGLVPRFQFAIPKSPLGSRTGKTEPVPIEVIADYHNLIRNLLSVEPKTENDKPLRRLVLSPKTKELWKAYWLENENKLRDGEKFGFLKDWGSKLPGTVARIAGNLHLVEKHNGSLDDLTVSHETMLRSISIAEILEDHALKAFNLMSSDPEMSSARVIAKWLKRTKNITFSQRECHKALFTYFPRVESLNEPFKILIERHCIREMDRPSKSGRPSKTFEVNPELWGDK